MSGCKRHLRRRLNTCQSLRSAFQRLCLSQTNITRTKQPREKMRINNVTRFANLLTSLGQKDEDLIQPIELQWLIRRSKSEKQHKLSQNSLKQIKTRTLNTNHLSSLLSRLPNRVQHPSIYMQRTHEEKKIKISEIGSETNSKINSNTTRNLHRGGEL